MTGIFGLATYVYKFFTSQEIDFFKGGGGCLKGQSNDKLEKHLTENFSGFFAKIRFFAYFVKDVFFMIDGIIRNS